MNVSRRLCSHSNWRRFHYEHVGDLGVVIIEINILDVCVRNKNKSISVRFACVRNYLKRTRVVNQI